MWSFTETAIHVSSANSKNVEKVMSDCDFSTRTPRWDKLPRYLNRYSFEPFQWNDDLPENHDTNREAYLRFLSDIIDVPNDYSIFDSSIKKLFSQVQIGSLQFSGNIDAILLDNRSIASKNFPYHIRLGIEVKKNVEDAHHYQACIAHLCASCLNRNETVLTLLTDLMDNWVFMYFGSSNFHKMMAEPNEAKFILHNIFNENNLQFLPEDFVNRLTWNEFFPISTPAVPVPPHTNFPPRDGNTGKRDGPGPQDDDNFVAPPPNLGSSGQKRSGDRNDTGRGGDSKKRRLKSRQTHTTGNRTDGGGNAETPAMLPFGGDVANELDLLDFIDDDEERKQITINYVLQHVVPLFNFPGCADKSSSSASQTQETKNDDRKEYMSSCTENNVVALSEHNLLRHNIAVRGNAGKINF